MCSQPATLEYSSISGTSSGAAPTSATAAWNVRCSRSAYATTRVAS
jgi:hypothetical protein